MKINQWIKKAYIKLDLKSTSKKEVIQELAMVLKDANMVSNFDLLLKDIYIRESLASTGIGLGVAIPHAKSKYIKQSAIVFAKSKKGVEYDALDHKKTHLFFLICTTENTKNDHLKALTSLSKKLIHESFRNQLLKANTIDEVYGYLSEIEI